MRYVNKHTASIIKKKVNKKKIFTEKKMTHENSNEQHDTSGEWTSTKSFMLNHIRDVNFPATVLVLYIIFSLVTKDNGIQDQMSRNLILGIGALALFGLYVYTHMWRNDERIARFYNGEYDTLGVTADNVLLVFGISYLVFMFAFWYMIREHNKNKGHARTKNCLYFLIVWALVLAIHHFWAFFA